MTPEPYGATGVPYGVTATLVSIKVSLPRDILLLLGCSEEIDPFLVNGPSYHGYIPQKEQRCQHPHHFPDTAPSNIRIQYGSNIYDWEFKV